MRPPALVTSTAVALLALGSISANAQSTTRCHEFAGTTTCETTPDPVAQLQQQQQQLNTFMADQQNTSAGEARPYSWRDVPPTKCTGMEKVGLPFALCAAREVAATRKGVGDLVAAGRCDDAVKAALGTGDLQFARDVRDYCAGK